MCLFPQPFLIHEGTWYARGLFNNTFLPLGFGCNLHCRHGRGLQEQLTTFCESTASDRIHNPVSTILFCYRLQSGTQMQVGLTVRHFRSDGYDHLTPICRSLDKLLQSSICKKSAAGEMLQKFDLTLSDSESRSFTRIEHSVG